MSNALVITQHALVRYFERIEGRVFKRGIREMKVLAESFAIASVSPNDVTQARRVITEQVLVSGVPLDWPDPLIVRTPTMQIVIRAGAVITIKQPTAKNRRGSNFFEPQPASVPVA